MRGAGKVEAARVCRSAFEVSALGAQNVQGHTNVHVISEMITGRETSTLHVYSQGWQLIDREPQLIIALGQM